MLILSGQLFLIFSGASYWGPHWNALLLLLSSLSLPLLYFNAPGQTEKERTVSNTSPLAGILSGIFFFLLLIPLFNAGFHRFANPSDYSDVMPQLQVQYERWVHGQFPYRPLEDISYHPYPVYMPLHWMPMGLAWLFHIDYRWSAYIVWGLVYGVWMYSVSRNKLTWYLQVALVLLPLIPVYAFLLWGEGDLLITPEIMIAAYYMLLAMALQKRKMAWIVVALVCCLLSRYTFVFWLPLLAWIWWKEEGWKSGIMVFLGVSVAVLLLFVFPFLLKDHTILQKGLAYHNGCAIAEWEGPFYTARHGINFAPFIKSITGTDCVYGVKVNRTIQAIALLLTLAIALFHYSIRSSRWRKSDFLLVYLYIFMLVFFVFCPLTYRYYLVVFLSLACMVGYRYIMGTPLPESDKN